MATFKLEDGTEVEAFTSEEVENLVSEKTEGMRNKLDELLGETKTAKQKAKELEEAQALAEEERQKEKGEFKSLYEKTQHELEQERENARKFRTDVQAKELESGSFKLASQLTKDTKRAELLAKEAKQFAVYGETGVKFEIGGVEVGADKVVEKLRADYPFLVDGSGANGGGAPGGKKDGGADNVNTQAQEARKKGDLAGYLKSTIGNHK